MHIIFDWAGTLLDDRDLAYQATCKAIEELGGKAPSKTYFENHFTTPAAHFYRQCNAKCDDDLADRKYFANYNELEDRADFFPDAICAIKYLYRKHNLYIVTTIEQDIVIRQLKRAGIDGFFKQVYGSARDKQAAFRAIMASLSNPEQQAVAVGDSLHEFHAAQSVNIPFGAALYGYLSEEKWKQARVENSFDSIWDICDWIQESDLQQSANIPLVTVGGLVFSGNKFLMIKTKKWSNLYGTPGGKVKYGETLEYAFHREIKEETGLEIENVQFILNQDCIDHPQFFRDRHFVLVNYIAKIKEGTSKAVKLNHESDDFRWCNFQEAEKLPVNQPTQVLINALKERGTW